MNSIKNLKKEAKIIKEAKESSYENKFIPIANKIFNDNKYKFLELIESNVKDHMANGYKRMFFSMYSQVNKICKSIGVTEDSDVSFISNYIDNCLIDILKKQGYLFSYVYCNTDYFHINYFIFWSKLKFIECKIKNLLYISDSSM